jgi:uncharacterized membrane protein YozB (DUF420 family)
LVFGAKVGDEAPPLFSTRVGENVVLTGPNVILALKIAVSAVTFLLLASLAALAQGKYRLHGRINVVFFTLTLAALLGLEVVVRIVDPNVFTYINENAELHYRLNVHLCFSIPATLLMPAMLYTGLTRRRATHLKLAVLFGILWTGTFLTGLFYLPHVP